jgi:uncharacterized membrane protein
MPVSTPRSSPQRKLKLIIQACVTLALIGVAVFLIERPSEGEHCVAYAIFAAIAGYWFR